MTDAMKQQLVKSSLEYEKNEDEEGGGKQWRWHRSTQVDRHRSIDTGAVKTSTEKTNEATMWLHVCLPPEIMICDFYWKDYDRIVVAVSDGEEGGGGGGDDDDRDFRAHVVSIY